MAEVRPLGFNSPSVSHQVAARKRRSGASFSVVADQLSRRQPFAPSVVNMKGHRREGAVHHSQVRNLAKPVNRQKPENNRHSIA